MATTKSASITNLNAIPVVQNTAGKGAAARLKHINDYLTAPVTTGNFATDARKLSFVRLPSTVRVKSVHIESAAQTQGTYNVGLFYSDATNDGTPVASQAAVIDADFFASAVACSSAVARTDITDEGGFYPVTARNKPLWEAAGLSADPGGFFDVVATSTNTVTVGGVMGVEVAFVE